MAIYKVTMVLAIDEGHPRKWLQDAINECLDDCDDILDLDIENINEEDLDHGLDIL